MTIKSITLTQSNWSRLRSQLSKDYPPSVLIIREKTKSVLGFTIRNHREWIGYPKTGELFPYDLIKLDFYNGSKKTFFLMKYSDFLDLTLDNFSNR